MTNNRLPATEKNVSKTTSKDKLSKNLDDSAKTSNIKNEFPKEEPSFDVKDYSTTDSEEEEFDSLFKTPVMLENEGLISYQLKIPKDRIGVLIGTDGRMKTRIEKETECKLKVDSTEGEVEITGDDGLKLYVAKNIITAIGRGFNPDTSLELLKQDYSFEVINLRDYCKKDHFQRIKGRVIGTEGKSRRLIEENTKCNVCVYGKTIGIIGRVEYVDIAKRACISLIEGSPHTSVYSWLEKKKREMKLLELTGKSVFSE